MFLHSPVVFSMSWWLIQHSCCFSYITGLHILSLNSQTHYYKANRIQGIKVFLLVLSYSLYSKMFKINAINICTCGWLTLCVVGTFCTIVFNTSIKLYLSFLYSILYWAIFFYVLLTM